MSIPLIYFFIPYALLMVIIVTIAIMSLYHLLHYGFFYFGAALATYAFFGILIVVLFWNYQELSSIDWGSATLYLGN
jgi:hypothetical protein